jgi:hypothetical protein
VTSGHLPGTGGGRFRRCVGQRGDGEGRAHRRRVTLIAAGCAGIPGGAAQLFGRVFFINALNCPRCSAALVVLALISDPPVIAKILSHLHLPTEPPPLAPARGSTASRALILDPPRQSPSTKTPVLPTLQALPNHRLCRHPRSDRGGEAHFVC